ncbi:MAG: hypothetical protein ACREOO_14120 [bacterium]
MFQRIISRPGSRTLLLGGAVIVFALMLASCCPPLLTTGTNGKSCSCAMTEKGNIATTGDVRAHLSQEHQIQSKEERFKKCLLH